MQRKHLSLALGLLLSATPLAAQIPSEFSNLQVFPKDVERAELIEAMRAFSFATGYRCEHCHVAEDPEDFSTFDFAADDKREKRVARDMLRMVNRINEEILSAVSDRGPAALEVGCVTCHGGKRIPTTLEYELVQAHREGGVDAVEMRYAELRQRYYGRGAYDFGARSLNDVVQRIGREEPAAALRLVELNLEQHPESIVTWNLKGSIHTLMEQRDEAIAAFERSMELGPNPPAEQALRQLRGGG